MKIKPVPKSPNPWPPILHALKLGHDSVYLLKTTQPCDCITLSSLFAALSIRDIRDHAKLRSLTTVAPKLITSLHGLPADLNQVLCKASILPPIEEPAFGAIKRRPCHPVSQRKQLDFGKDETGSKATEMIGLIKTGFQKRLSNQGEPFEEKS